MSEESYTDIIGYNYLIDRAMRQVVAGALQHVQKYGLSGKHYFHISFNTQHPDVRLPNYLKAKYPYEMGIILQNQFWDLHVTDAGFSILLKFDGKPEKIYVAFDALLMFSDRGVNFILRFTPEIGGSNRLSPLEMKPTNKNTSPVSHNSGSRSTLKRLEFDNDLTAHNDRKQPDAGASRRSGTTSRLKSQQQSSVNRSDEPAGKPKAKILKLDQQRKR